VLRSATEAPSGGTKSDGFIRISSIALVEETRTAAKSASRDLDGSVAFSTGVESSKNVS
jgi:hypothetical protein